MNDIISSYVLVIFNAKTGYIHKIIGNYSCSYNDMINECKKRGNFGTKNMLVGFVNTTHKQLTLLANKTYNSRELEEKFVCTAIEL